MKSPAGITTYCTEFDPVRRAKYLYGMVLSVITLANLVFVHCRIAVWELSAFLPETGAFLLYLWIILFLDEFVWVLQANKHLAYLVGSLKRLGFFLVALYALAALALVVNCLSLEPVRTKQVKAVALSDPYRGTWGYGQMLVAGWDDRGRRREIPLLSPEEASLYAGQDVEVVVRKGILSLDRVLEVRQDWKGYYRKMLRAIPDSPVAVKGLVLTCMERSELSEAQRWYTMLEERNADDDGVGTRLAQRMIEARQFAPAAALLERIVLKDRSYENLYTLGYALAWAGEKREAEKYLSEATALDPTDYRAFYSLGYVCQDTNQLKKAEQAWSAVLKLMPHFPEVERNLQSVKQRLATQSPG